MSEKMKIAVAGTGYVGLSLAVLLSQHNEVRALDIVSEKVEKINAFQSPIQDDEIELFLAEAKAGTRKLDLPCNRGRRRGLYRRGFRHRGHANELRLGPQLFRHLVC